MNTLETIKAENAALHARLESIRAQGAALAQKYLPPTKASVLARLVAAGHPVCAAKDVVISEIASLQKQFPDARGATLKLIERKRAELAALAAVILAHLLPVIVNAQSPGVYLIAQVNGDNGTNAAVSSASTNAYDGFPVSEYNAMGFSVTVKGTGVGSSTVQVFG
jgi:hypothetical protein